MTVSGCEQPGSSLPEVSDHRGNYIVEPVTGANSLSIACQSAKGPGGTSDTHTHKLRAMVSFL